MVAETTLALRPASSRTLEIVGGSTVPTPEIYQRMWGRTIIPTVGDAVTRFRKAGPLSIRALRSSSDVTLEPRLRGPPVKRGDLAVTAMLTR